MEEGAELPMNLERTASERATLETMILETTILKTMISETIIGERMIDQIVIDETTIDETTNSETRKPRSESSALARRCWMVTAWLSLLALPGAGWAQTTLRTPPAGDPHCVGDDCATAPRAPAGKGQAATTADPAEATPNHALPNRNNNNDEAGGIAAPEPPNEFQEFVASSIGYRLPIYGYRLFDRVPTTFAPVDRIPVTADYLIGPGDEILIRAWGQIDLDGKLVVDRGGEVFLPKVGALSVAGLKYQQLPEYFRIAIGRVFRNFDLTVSLGQLRSIQVFVVGQARRPGTYTVSSLSTLVNALFASGGPSSAGSMRHIELKRNNRVVTEFDFYDLLLKGDKSNDARLLTGDVIYIPPAGPSIAIAGSVNVPAIYELRDRTSLGSAIEIAGGLATTADGQKAAVERIENHATRRVEEFPLDGPGLERILKDGDVVRIFSLSPRFQNAVTLRGNVAHPGRVEWHSGMRLKDVLRNQDALVTRDYWRAANSVSSAGERRSQPFERQPAPARAASETTPAELRNQIRRDAPETEPAELRNQITRDAPEINWDYAVIQRLNPEDLTTRLVPFNLGKLVLQGDEQSNLALEPGDVITIFSQNDLAVPLEKQNKFVRLEGEFLAAGVYRAEPGETVRHLVERVGGFTPNAYLYGSEFTRESVRLNQQRGLDQMIEKLEEDISRSALAPRGVSPEEVADGRARLEAQRQLVGKLREVKATGRVVLELKPDSTSAGDLPDIALEDGDRFVVPYRPPTIEILGAVYNKNSFLYRREQRVDDYLKRAGGLTRDADTGRMFVIRADGSVLSRQSVKGLWNGGFASLRLMPGDAIIVPERLNHGSVLKGLRDWSQVFAQFALGAAAVRVIQ
jgi:polysaccharide biosynthesis/export protein